MRQGGVAEALQAAGFVGMQLPVLLADPAELSAPALPVGVRIVAVDCPARQDQVDVLCAKAFGALFSVGEPPRADSAMGGSVLALLDREPVAAASWTAVCAGTSEVVGVTTVLAQRRRGLGAAVTAAAAAGAGRGGADLVWLAPSSDGAQRMYRALGFTEAGPTASGSPPLPSPDPAGRDRRCPTPAVG